MNPVLIKLARMSPKYYRDTIRERNRQLLAQLRLLKPYLGMGVETIPDQVVAEAMKTVHLGCPHCLAVGLYTPVSCNCCLWYKARGDGRGCTSVDFSEPEGSLALTALRLHGSNRVLTVTYLKSSAYLAVEHGAVSRFLNPTEYDECERFLQAHIEWAELDCWGEDFNPQAAAVMPPTAPGMWRADNGS